MDAPNPGRKRVIGACKARLDEVLDEEACIEEAADVVMYFCDVEHYRVWRGEMEEAGD